MRDLMTILEADSGYPEVLGTFGNSDPYQHFSSSVLLKQMIEENPHATVALGPRPGTIRVTMGDLTLIAKIESHE